MNMIIENQMLEVDNLISFRGQLKQCQLDNIADEMKKYIAFYGARPTGKPITATYSVDNGIMDMEILLPLDKEVPTSQKFIFKEKLKIVNEIKISHFGEISSLQLTCNGLNKYIITHKLTPITVGYNVIRNVENDLNNNPIIDIYVGISPNIL